MTIEKTDIAPAVHDGEYVLPAPPRGRAEVVVTPSPVRQLAAFDHGASVARAFGERMMAQADGLAALLGELRERLSQLDTAVGDATRAQLKGAVREIVSLVDWCDAVEAGLRTECESACRGHEPIDVLALCQDVARTDEAPASITVLGNPGARWWGDRAALSGLVRDALTLVAERTGGHGGRVLEVDLDDGATLLAVRGRGEPADGVDPVTVHSFRTAVARLGAVVEPDALGVGGAGLVVRLPKAGT